MKRDFTLFARGAAFLIALIGYTPIVHAGSITIISQSGDSIGLESSLTFNSYSLPTINRYGEVAFGANVQEFETGDSRRFETICMHAGGGLHLIATSGGIAPDPGDDDIFEFFEEPRISNSGIIMFRGKVEGPSWADRKRNIWIGWIVNQGGQVTPHLDILSRMWDRAAIDYSGNHDEEGGKYDFISNPSIVEPKTFTFTGVLERGAYDGVAGLWHQQAKASETWSIPKPTLLALTGLPLPGESTPLARVDAYTPISSDRGILLAELETGGSVNQTNNLGLWIVEPETNAIPLVRSGSIDTTTGRSFAYFGKPVANSNGGIAMWASVDNEAQSEGIYLVNQTGTSAIATTASSLTIESTSLQLSSLYDPVINEQGDVAFLAHMVGNTGENPNQAVLLRSGSGAWSIIAQTGQQVPGTFNGTTFSKFGQPFINELGQVAFIAELDGEGDVVSDTTDFGIWAIDVDGFLNLVAREGDTIETAPGRLKTISNLNIGGFNEAGTLALRIGYTDGSSSIGVARTDQATPPSIVGQPQDTEGYIGKSITLSVEASGTGPFTYEWSKNGVSLGTQSSKSYVISNAANSDAGSYSVVVSSPIGEATSLSANVSVLSLPETPAFIEQPISEIAFHGNQAILTAEAVSSQVLSYQWYKDGVAIPGANESQLILNTTRPEDEGSYYVVASTSSGSMESEPAEIVVTDKRLINISTRAYVGTGANVLIAGFVVDGPDPKTVLVRGVGPSLPGISSENILHRPKVDLYGGGQVIASNTAWKNAPNQTELQAAAASVGAFALPTNSDDVVFIAQLQPGDYGAVLSGENESTGIGMIEVYEIGSNLTRLINISSRAFVGNGERLLIPGIVVSGDLPTKVLVRAVGPGLKDQSIAGYLEDPILQVVTSSGAQIASNSSWQDVPNLQSLNTATQLVGAFPLSNNSRDAALLVELQPGSYAAFVTGRDGTTGVALVEVYELPNE